MRVCTQYTTTKHDQIEGAFKRCGMMNAIDGCKANLSSVPAIDIYNMYACEDIEEKDSDFEATESGEETESEPEDE